MNKLISGCGFNHIALTAADFDRSVKFYEALGFVPTVGWGEGTGRAQMFDLGDGGVLELFASGDKNGPVSGKWAHLALSADDPDAAYALALSAGATPVNPPKTVEVASHPYPMSLHIAFVAGPDGEQIEFFHREK